MVAGTQEMVAGLWVPACSRLPVWCDKTFAAVVDVKNASVLSLLLKNELLQIINVSRKEEAENKIIILEVMKDSEFSNINHTYFCKESNFCFSCRLTFWKWKNKNLENQFISIIAEKNMLIWKSLLASSKKRHWLKIACNLVWSWLTANHLIFLIFLIRLKYDSYFEGMIIFYLIWNISNFR